MVLSDACITHYKDWRLRCEPRYHSGKAKNAGNLYGDFLRERQHPKCYCAF
jgi:hypothetical protein